MALASFSAVTDFMIQDSAAFVPLVVAGMKILWAAPQKATVQKLGDPPAIQAYPGKSAHRLNSANSRLFSTFTSNPRPLSKHLQPALKRSRPMVTENHRQTDHDCLPQSSVIQRPVSTDVAVPASPAQGKLGTRGESLAGNPSSHTVIYHRDSKNMQGYLRKSFKSSRSRSPVQARDHLSRTFLDLSLSA